MPIKVQSDDGAIHEFPDNTGQDIIDRVMKNYVKQAPAEPSTAMDVLQSGARGAVKGAVGLAGLPGEAERFIGRRVSDVGSFFGARPRTEEEIESAATLPSVEKIQHGVESITGKFGTPKTGLGKVAESIGEFAPGAALGPGGPLMKGAMAVGGGLGAEFGETFAGPWGRFIGGMAGGFGAGIAGLEAPIIRAGTQLKDFEQVKQAATNAFEEVKKARVGFKPNAINEMVNDAYNVIDEDLITEVQAPSTFLALKKLGKGSGDIANILGIREKLQEITPKEGKDFIAAIHAKRAIDNLLENAPPKDIAFGDPQYASALLKHGRGNWRVFRNAELMQDAKTLAEHRAATSGTGANTINAYRQEFRKILDNDKKSRYLPEPVKNKIEELVMGTTPTNRARYVSKWAPSGPVSGLPMFLAALAGHFDWATGIGLAGWLAKHLGTYLTRKQIREIQDLVLSEAPINKAVAGKIGQKRPTGTARAATVGGLAEAMGGPSLSDMVYEDKGRLQ